MAARQKAVDISADAREFVDLLGKTSAVDKKLKTALRRNIRNAAKIAAEASKTEVRKAPLRAGKRTRSRGLRSAIAGGIKIQIATGANSSRVGVYIRSTGSGLAGSRKKLVRRWDRGEFRHMVFGHRDVWVSQAGRPYFGSVIRTKADDVNQAVRKALNEAKAAIEN